MAQVLTHPSPVLEDDWRLACSRDGLTAPVSQFLEVTDVLLERPQLNSTHLFRADILFDSARKLSTIYEKDGKIEQQSVQNGSDLSRDCPSWPNFALHRTIVRRLIPRKPQLDKPLDQSCFVLHEENSNATGASKVLVIYVPHVDCEAEVPWYHPKIRAIAYLYASSPSLDALAVLSIHYVAFDAAPDTLPIRLERTFVSLLETLIRLLRLPSRSGNSQDASVEQAKCIPTLASTLKDTLLPHHTVQNTYSELKQRYASLLISRWTEKTDPAKHVFEDLGIAAFLIELWKTMYARECDGSDKSREGKRKWSGFVDIACGNGVLVWVLCREGWEGWGFDARRRATWDMLEKVDSETGDCERKVRLEERICVPKVFLDAMGMHVDEAETILGTKVCDGVWGDGVFIVSNHADELSLWTPLLGALAADESSWFAIPCCSHGLDGGRRRYNLKDVQMDSATPAKDAGEDEQTNTGDLKALRARRKREQTHSDDKSMYSCLTKKMEAIAKEVGYDVEMSLIRIPSTRNIGIVGGRKRVATKTQENGVVKVNLDTTKIINENHDSDADVIQAIVERECAATGGIEASARTWLEKCKRLHAGQGRGKVNWKGPQHCKHEIDTTSKTNGED